MGRVRSAGYLLGKDVTPTAWSRVRNCGCGVGRVTVTHDRRGIMISRKR